MNKRIRELVVESGNGQMSDGRLYPHIGSRTEEDWKKFAELFIQECMMLLHKEQEYYSKPGAYEPRDYYERCRAKEEAFADAARIIKNHFGVEN